MKLLVDDPKSMFDGAKGYVNDENEYKKFFQWKVEDYIYYRIYFL